MDYHIYIHSANGGSNPTKPKETIQPKPTKPKIIEEVEEDSPLKEFAFKAGAVVVLAKVAEKAVSAVSSYMSKETGNYVFSRNFNNSLATFKAITNPISTTISFINFEQQARLNNQRSAESRVLMGDSFISKGIRRV